MAQHDYNPGDIFIKHGHALFMGKDLRLNDVTDNDVTDNDGNRGYIVGVLPRKNKIVVAWYDENFESEEDPANLVVDL